MPEESYFCPVEKAHSGFRPWLPFTFVQNDSEQIKRDITGLEEWDPQHYLLSIGADAADEEGLSSTQSLQQLTERSLKRNRQKHLFCLQISLFWVAFDSSTASSSEKRFFQVWLLYKSHFIQYGCSPALHSWSLYFFNFFFLKIMRSGVYIWCYNSTTSAYKDEADCTSELTFHSITVISKHSLTLVK